MKHALAHGMRRAARMLIRQSNKLDPPHRDHVHTAIGRTSGAQFAAGIQLVVAEERLARARRAQAQAAYVAPKLKPGFIDGYSS